MLPALPTLTCPLPSDTDLEQHLARAPAGKKHALGACFPSLTHLRGGSRFSMGRPTQVLWMEAILHHLICPICCMYPRNYNIMGLLSGARFPPSTRAHSANCRNFHFAARALQFGRGIRSPQPHVVIPYRDVDLKWHKGLGGLALTNLMICLGDACKNMASNCSAF